MRLRTPECVTAIGSKFILDGKRGRWEVVLPVKINKEPCLVSVFANYGQPFPYRDAAREMRSAVQADAANGECFTVMHCEERIEINPKDFDVTFDPPRKMPDLLQPLGGRKK